MLKEVAILNEIEFLDITATLTTDDGLKELVEMKHLKTLNAYGTKVTDEGILALNNSLPACKVRK